MKIIVGFEEKKNLDSYWLKEHFQGAVSSAVIQDVAALLQVHC